MAYSAEISRQNPSCILFLIDQSGSMSDPFGGEQGHSKAARLADAVNRLLFELAVRCTKDQTEGVRNYYDVGVIGYGARVGPGLGGNLTGRWQREWLRAGQPRMAGGQQAGRRQSVWRARHGRQRLGVGHRLVQ